MQHFQWSAGVRVEVYGGGAGHRRLESMKGVVVEVEVY